MAGSPKINAAYKMLIIALALSSALLLYRYFPHYTLVETVLNGETLLLENGTVVKLIGVDAAEEDYSDEQRRTSGLMSAEFTQRMVEGKKVRIKYHRQQGNMDGRAVASVYLLDGTFLNAEIIKQGYGRADSACASGGVEIFQEYERQARENKRGLWAEMSGD